MDLLLHDILQLNLFITPFNNAGNAHSKAEICKLIQRYSWILSGAAATPWAMALSSSLMEGYSWETVAGQIPATTRASYPIAMLLTLFFTHYWSWVCHRKKITSLSYVFPLIGFWDLTRVNIVRFLALIRPCLGLFPFMPTFFSYRFLAIILVSASSTCITELSFVVTFVEYTPSAWDLCSL